MRKISLLSLILVAATCAANLNTPAAAHSHQSSYGWYHWFDGTGWVPYDQTGRDMGLDSALGTANAGYFAPPQTLASTHAVADQSQAHL